MSDHNPFDNDSLAQSRESKADQARLAQQTEAEDTKWLMESKRGRRILWRVLERTRVFHPSFNTNSMTMAFAEGARNEGLRTLSLIQAHCPELYPTMLKEANK